MSDVMKRRSFSQNTHKSYQAGYQTALRERSHEIKRLQNTVSDLQIQLDRLAKNAMTAMVVWRAGVVGLVSARMRVQMWPLLRQIVVEVYST